GACGQSVVQTWYSNPTCFSATPVSWLFCMIYTICYRSLSRTYNNLEYSVSTRVVVETSKYFENQRPVLAILSQHLLDVLPSPDISPRQWKPHFEFISK